MASTSESVALLNVVVAAATSGSKGSPGAITAGGFFNNIGRYNSPVGVYIKNGDLAPGAPVTVVIQVADAESGPWTDYETILGETAAYSAGSLAGLVTRTIVLEKVRYVRAIAFGNTSQDVEVKVRLHSVTGL